MVHGSPQFTIGPRGSNVLRLHRRGASSTGSLSRLLSRGWTRVNSTLATVVADVVGGLIDDRLVVDVVDVGDIDIVHGTVVVEGPVVPIPALVAFSTVSEAVVHATVEADLRPPVSIVKSVRSVVPAPIAGRPEQARFGSFDPGAGHPVIVFIAIGPVAWRPNIALTGRDRLRVDGQRGRSE